MANQDNKEKKEKKKSKTLTIFFTTFIITFAFVALAVKYFSPEIDVEIGKATEEEQQDEEDKGSVDERLRWIQFEDNMPGVSTRLTNNQEENNKQNVKEVEADNVIEYDEDTTTKQPSEIVKEPVVNVERVKPQVPTEAKPAVTTPKPASSTSSKVYVGQYSTIEQAIAMQDRLASSGLNLAPFVKKVGSHYVVQVGSYASSQKAQSVAAEIQNAGYAARVVSE